MLLTITEWLSAEAAKRMSNPCVFHSIEVTGEYDLYVSTCMLPLEGLTEREHGSTFHMRMHVCAATASVLDE